jgi:hypothetical protein
VYGRIGGLSSGFRPFPRFSEKPPRQFSLNDVVRRINAGFHKITVRQYKNILIFSRITPDAPEKQGDSPFRHDSARVPTVSARLAHDWRGTT